MAKLRRRQEFEAVFSSPTRALVRPLFIIRALAKPCGPPRLGIVASKKALRRAIDRNRAKRLVRETFRVMQGERLSVDMVVQVRREFGHARRAEVRGELIAAFRRILQPHDQ
jgi:ribonuclease P protein component